MRFWNHPLLRSIGLHAALTVAATSFFVYSPTDRRSLQAPGTSSLVVEVSDADAVRGKEARARVSNPRPRPRAHPRIAAHPSLKHLGVPLPGISSALPEVTDSSPMGGESSLASEAGHEGYYGSGDPLAKATDEDTSLYRYLYSVIERNLTYPAEFHGTGIQGTVNVTLHFDEEGIWRKERSSFQASNPYLRVHVIRLLRRALREKIPENLWKSRAKLAIDCTFRFLITESGDLALLESKRVVFGKSLSFARRIQKSVLEWQVGPLSGLGPFSASLNPLWFFEKARDVVAPRIKIDPLEKYRNDPDW